MAPFDPVPKGIPKGVTAPAVRWSERERKVDDMAHRVLYYTLDGDTRRADEILDGWGMRDRIELVGCAHEPLAAPTADQLAGCSGLIGEFAPVIKDTVDEAVAAGVRVVASMSIGLNHLDLARLADHGVVVANCPGYCAEDVAAHTVALMLDLMRKVTFSNRDVLAGGWDPKVGYEAYRTQGRTLGLVFFGSIAQAVAPIARALGMRVLVWAPTKTAEELSAHGCERAGTLDELLEASDVVSLHCPLIPETRGLIGARELALMKPTAYLVNTARGEIVDEDALIGALDAGAIRAAGLDVIAHETHPDPRIIHHPRVIVTPHAAYDSVEAADNLRLMSLEAVCDVLVRGIEPAHAVDRAACAAQGLSPR